VDGLLPESGFSLLVAKPKVGKSTLARNLALCVAAQGKTFFGRSVQHGPVIYLALEEKRSEVKKHFQEMGATGDEPIDISTTSAPADGLAQVRAIAEQRKPVLIIIDPLFRFTRVKDGNDYAQVTQALEPLLRLARETRAHVLCVHHSGKTHREDGDNILGSTAIFGSVDTLLTMKRYRQDADDYRTIASIQRYGDDLPETVLHYDKITRTTNLGASKQQEDVNRIQQAILAYLQTQEDDRESGIPPTEPQIAEDVEGKTVHKRKALRELVESRRILRLGRGGKGDPFRYALTDSRFAGSHVPHRYREPGNKNPKMDADQQKSSADSCSQTFQSSENTGNKNPTLETDLLYAPNVEKHVTEEVFE
jgi:hypothetical protein